MPSAEFNTDEPIAFFLTWTTYGTWLPGDERGWNRKHQGKIQAPNPELEAAARKTMTEPEFYLDESHRAIVKTTIEQHCNIRGWHLHVANPRTNHVHVVVTARGYAPHVVRDQLKAWCTRKLKDAGVVRENMWSEGGSKRSINTFEELDRVVFYASEGQDRKSRDAQ